MDHLNVFNPYRQKSNHHEDELDYPQTKEDLMTCRRRGNSSSVDIPALAVRGAFSCPCPGKLYVHCSLYRPHTTTGQLSSYYHACWHQGQSYELYTWEKERAVELDRAGNFVDDFRHKVRDAFEALGVTLK